MGSSSPHRHRCLFNRGKLQAMVDGTVIVMLLHAVAILGSKSRFHAVSQLGQPRSHAAQATPGRCLVRRPAGQGPETPHRADAILTGTSCSDSFMVASCPPLLIASSSCEEIGDLEAREPTSRTHEYDGAIAARTTCTTCPPLCAHHLVRMSLPAVHGCMDVPLMRRHGEL